MNTFIVQKLMNILINEFFCTYFFTGNKNCDHGRIYL